MTGPKTIRHNGGGTDHHTEAAKVTPVHGRGQLAIPWRRGQSGNPFGMPNHPYNEARKTCAQATPQAIARQIELMQSQDERVALMATEAVLRRGIGAPRDHSTEDRDGSRINLSGLSSDELRSLADLLRKALGV